MKKVILSLFLQGLIAIVVLGQTDRADKPRLVRIPRDKGAVMFLYQPDCPLKIESAETFVVENGKYPKLRYVVRNSSSRGIRYFSVEFKNKYAVRQWSQYGFGFEDGFGNEDRKAPTLLAPNDRYESLKKDEFEVVPMSKEVERLITDNIGDSKLRIGNVSVPEVNEPKMKIIWIGMITKVIFEDGTVFEATELSRNLADFLY